MPAAEVMGVKATDSRSRNLPSQPRRGVQATLRSVGERTAMGDPPLADGMGQTIAPGQARIVAGRAGARARAREDGIEEQHAAELGLCLREGVFVRERNPARAPIIRPRSAAVRQHAHARPSPPPTAAGPGRPKRDQPTNSSIPRPAAWPTSVDVRLRTIAEAQAARCPVTRRRGCTQSGRVNAGRLPGLRARSERAASRVRQDGRMVNGATRPGTVSCGRSARTQPVGNSCVRALRKRQDFGGTGRSHNLPRGDMGRNQ